MERRKDTGKQNLAWNQWIWDGRPSDFTPVNTGIPRQGKYRFVKHNGMNPRDVLKRTGKLDLGAKGVLEQ